MEGKKSSTTLTGRAWRLRRLALCWARKVVAFDLLSPPDDDGIIRRGDRELSFEEEETPIFRFKKTRAPRHGRMRMSCMNAPPEVELDMEEEEEERFERNWGEDQEERVSCEVMEEEKEIDSRAEEFIKRFHEQLRMQRQSSFLQYSEMIQRSAS